MGDRYLKATRMLDYECESIQQLLFLELDEFEVDGGKKSEKSIVGD